MGSLAQITGQLRTLWARLGRTQQMALIGLGGGALVFAFLFMRMGGGQPEYVTAFTNLDPKDANAASEQLKSQGIPFELSADGSTIKVPAAQVADAKLKLAAKGLPAGGAVGFELFDKTSFGVTDFVQNLNYQRALEGELTRTINTLEQVEGSRVHIVVPKQELFVSQQKPATASVLLRLRPGRTLDETALKGISHMVARSVQGLEEKNITIIDSSGRMLFDGASGANSAIGLSATQLDVQKKVEKNLETELQSLLDRVAGPSRSAVRVNVDMDFSQQETLNKTFTPGGPNNQGVARSSATVQETFTGAAAAGQQPGAAANVAPTRANLTAAAGNNSEYQRSETTTNYEVSENVQKTTRGPGEVRRLSVSVLLDASIGEADATALRDAVAAAAGIDQRRGDQIVVTTAAFNGATADTLAVEKPSLVDTLMQYGKLAVPLLAALIVLLVIWRMSRSAIPQRPRARVIMPQLAAAGVPGGAQWVEAPLAPGALLNVDLSDRTESLPQPSQRIESPEEIRRRTDIHDRMINLAVANPEAIGEIIHTWMSQDDKKA